MKCIACQTHEVNPMITGSYTVPGKSFCSRSCQNVYLTSAEYLSDEALKRIALLALENADNRRTSNN